MSGGTYLKVGRYGMSIPFAIVEVVLNGSHAKKLVADADFLEDVRGAAESLLETVSALKLKYGVDKVSGPVVEGPLSNTSNGDK